MLSCVVMNAEWASPSACSHFPWKTLLHCLVHVLKASVFFVKGSILAAPRLHGAREWEGLGVLRLSPSHKAPSRAAGAVQQQSRPCAAPGTPWVTPSHASMPQAGRSCPDGAGGLLSAGLCFCAVKLPAPPDAQGSVLAPSCRVWVLCVLLACSWPCARERKQELQHRARKPGCGC